MSAFQDFHKAMSNKNLDDKTCEKRIHDIAAMSFYIASVLLIKRAIHEGDVEIVAYTIARILADFDVEVKDHLKLGDY